MIFELKTKQDKFIEDAYKKSMKEIGEFYGINWIHNTPKMIIWKNREIINKFEGNKTEDWFVGKASGRNIFLLDRKNYEKESSHKYSHEKYSALLKHEIAHLFFGILSKNNHHPIWLNEGLAIYLSGQNKFKRPPKEFKIFLDYFNKGGRKVYREPGFFIELLIKKFGKQKILKLIKSLSKINSEKKFKQEFKKIYKFNLNYKEINKLYKNAN